MISLYDLIEYANGQLFGEAAAQIFTRFALTPEDADSNTLFVAYRSDTGDSYRYIEEAIAHGASGVICSRPPNCDTSGVSVILVKDPVDALMAWARKVIGKFGTKIIGVAGSAGKSTTAAALKKVLETRYRVHIGDFSAHDTRLAIPMAVASLRPEHQYAVLRLNATRQGEFSAMIEAAQPEIGIITNIHHDYLDRFRSVDEIAQEYAGLLKYLSPNSLAILNYDDDRVRPLGDQARAKVMTASIDNFGGDIMAYNVIEGLNGTGFDLRFHGEKYIARWVPLIGKFQLYAVLMAILVGTRCEIPIEDALNALKNLDPLPGRVKPLTGQHNSVLIDDTTSATPESTLAALEWIANVKDDRQRVFVVLGDIDHLGAYIHTAYRQIGRRAASVADVIIAQGTQAAMAARAALDEGKDSTSVHITYGAHDSVKLMRERYTLTPDDIVLVKGGRSMMMHNIVEALVSSDNQLPETNSKAPFQPPRPTWVEINSNALANNVRLLKKLIGDKVALMAIVKADAYGHGAVSVSQTALLNGAEYLGVGNLEEALQLRSAGIDAPILIMNYVPAYGVRQAMYHNLTLTIYDMETARTYERIARDGGGRLKVHVKVDTGMGRLGVMPADTVGLFRSLLKIQSLQIEGLYTHLSSADEDTDYTDTQIEQFRGVTRPLRAAGFDFKYIHAANTPGTLRGEKMHFNMVRTGLAMYGLHPANDLRLPEGFKPVMTWKTVVAQVKTLPPDHPVGYGRTYKTKGEETIAVICVGYADGFRRAPQHPQQVLIHGVRAPVIGRVSMEKTIVNVSHIPNVSMGDEVVLLGQQGDESITAEEIAAWLNTSNYEVVCSLLPRVPRQ